MKEHMYKWIIGFQDTDRAMGWLTGGKGANLGELSRIRGIRVPNGFCVTTEAYQKVTGHHTGLQALLEKLTRYEASDRETIRSLSASIRSLIEGIPIPQDIAAEITAYIRELGEESAYAVRSSATAEDLPNASFAGQQDSFLNITGDEAILRHISLCWASLFTERAVLYRIQNGFGHYQVHIAVIVQQMVQPQAAGVMFTADPISSNRKVVSIDAARGLGEALVAGTVNPDNYEVHDDGTVNMRSSNKSPEDDGIYRQGVNPFEHERNFVLTKEQITRLAQTGRQIEAHFGAPQDIEWCLADSVFYIVQSRPITTLFPIPTANDSDNHVYISVGHQQMMTDAMKPLGLSVWQLSTGAHMRAAGGRLFVDVTPILQTAAGRRKLIDTLGQSDPLLKGALTEIVHHREFLRLQPEDETSLNAPTPLDYLTLSATDPAIVAVLINRTDTSVATLREEINTRSGTDVFDYIKDHIMQMKQEMHDPQNMGAVMAGMNASAWINEKMKEWLGEKNVADTITLSAPNNITSEMGLALMDVADVIRPFPAVVQYLQHTNDDDFLNVLPQMEGGKEARNAIVAFLDKYGMRCAGEIDITRKRWSEKPAILLPLLLNNIRNFTPGAGARKFEQGRQDAMQKEQEILAKLRQLPDGEEKAAATKRMIDQVRGFIGYREYPKYGIINRYYLYKQALLKEAHTLVEAGILRELEDMNYLTFEALREAVRTHEVEYESILREKELFNTYEKLTPPRVITSDGEIITGNYNHENLPAGAIPGLPVSAGIAEGRARVILNIEEAELEAGDILVTTFTDPSWTPSFVSISGLITEVGGLMTHGAVIAREYGLPAVVGVNGATKLIKDGQRIRVNGTEGFIEII